MEAQQCDTYNTRGNYETEDSCNGPKDYLAVYLASLKSIPKMSAIEEADLLARWHKFKDMKAREKVIAANLRVVPPIAFNQARKFRLDPASIANKNRARKNGLRLQDGSCARDLISEGNLALVKAFDSFRPRSNIRFKHYARTCVRNAVVRHAVSLLSVVDRPWGKRVTQDIGIDPLKPDIVGVDESTGGRQAKPTSQANDQKRTSNFAALRSRPEPPRVFDATELPWILAARLKGFKLKDIALELGVSIPTAHRRVKAAIQEVRHA